MNTLALYNEQTDTPGLPVAVRILEQHEDPESCNDFLFVEITKEEESFYHNLGTTFGRIVADRIRRALVI